MCGIRTNGSRNAKYMSKAPFPLACTFPRCEKCSPMVSLTREWVLSLMFTMPTTPLLSMRLAVLTVSPQMSRFVL